MRLCGKGTSILTYGLLLAWTALAAGEPAKERIAVVDFDVQGDVGVTDAGKIVSRLLLSEFQDRFELVTRTQLEKLLKEKNLQVSDLMAASKAVEYGKLLPVKYLVVGEVMKGADYWIAAQLVEVGPGVIRSPRKVSGATYKEIEGKIPLLGKLVSMSDDEYREWQKSGTRATQKAASYSSEQSFFPYQPPEGMLVNRLEWAPDGQTALFSLGSYTVDYKGDTIFALDVKSGEVSPWMLRRGQHPVYSPDGRKVAVCLPEAKGIAIVDPAKRTLKESIRYSAWWPSFTYDGRRICYVTRQEDRQGVFVAGADGADQRQVSDAGWGGNRPSASPCEDLVAYDSEKAAGICVQQISGEGAVLFKTSTGGLPKWSPDGQMISYLQDGNVHVMERKGKGIVRVTGETSGTWGEGYAWSPDGSMMIYHITQGNRSGFKIVSVDLNAIRQKLGVGEGR